MGALSVFDKEGGVSLISQKGVNMVEEGAKG